MRYLIKMPSRCFDPDCWKSESIDYNMTRRETLHHVQNKPQQKIIAILQENKILNIDYSILSRWTICNLFTDLCFVDNQEKLIRCKEDSKVLGDDLN